MNALVAKFDFVSITPESILNQEDVDFLNNLEQGFNLAIANLDKYESDFKVQAANEENAYHIYAKETRRDGSFYVTTRLNPDYEWYHRLMFSPAKCLETIYKLRMELFDSVISEINYYFSNYNIKYRCSESIEKKMNNLSLTFLDIKNDFIDSLEGINPTNHAIQYLKSKYFNKEAILSKNGLKLSFVDFIYQSYHKDIEKILLYFETNKFASDKVKIVLTNKSGNGFGMNKIDAIYVFMNNNFELKFKSKEFCQEFIGLYGISVTTK